MLVEYHGADVRRVNDHVDDGELGVGVIGCDLTQSGAESETGHDDRVGAGFSEAAERLLALGFGLKLDLVEAAAGFFGPAERTVIGGFVKRLVELAAEIEDQRRISHCRASGKGDGGGCAEKFGGQSHLVLPVNYMDAA